MTAQTTEPTRNPAVAGSFYPDDPDDLRRTVAAFLAAGKKGPLAGTLRALVVPHAGYVFSGGVAASGYNQIDPKHPYKRIFVLASSHRVDIGKASVYVRGDYRTPLGIVPVDREISTALARNKRFFSDNPEAHFDEHSLEVQLPFLQVVFKTPIPIVPIVLGTQDPAVCRGIADALKPYFTAENLFVISSDFSHYPSYEDAIKADAATAEAFCTGSPDRFLEALRNNDRRRVPGLLTSMCAWPSGLTLLYLAEGNPNLSFKVVDYANSGDIKSYGDKKRVVGYNALAVSEAADPAEFKLTAADKAALLRIARTTIESLVRNGEISELETKDISPTLREPAGAFVTLRKHGELRGCIGMFEPVFSLSEVVQKMAVASSMRDTRFTPVGPGELDDIRIEISVLTPRRKIKNIREIRLGTDGIYIQKGFQNGTFLPQVATETGWTLEEFLGHCARDKAGLDWDGWKNADIFVFEAIIFEEPAR